MGAEGFSRESKRQAARNALRAAVAASIAALSSAHETKAQDLHDVVQKNLLHAGEPLQRLNAKEVPAYVSEWPPTEVHIGELVPLASDTERLTPYTNLLTRLKGVHLQRGEGVTEVPQYNKFCEGFADFCTRFASPEGRMIHTSDAETILRIIDINTSVNISIEQKNDEIIGEIKDHWTIASEVGDCEDLVFLKIHKLLKAQLNPVYFHFIIVDDENKEGHAVLGIDVIDEVGAKHTLILDNRQPHVMTLDEMEKVYRGKLATFITPLAKGGFKVDFASYRSKGDSEAVRAGLELQEN